MQPSQTKSDSTHSSVLFFHQWAHLGAPAASMVQTLGLRSTSSEEPPDDLWRWISSEDKEGMKTPENQATEMDNHWPHSYKTRACGLELGRGLSKLEVELKGETELESRKQSHLIDDS